HRRRHQRPVRKEEIAMAEIPVRGAPRMLRPLYFGGLCIALLACTAGRAPSVVDTTATNPPPTDSSGHHDWMRFGWDVAGSSAPSVSMSVTAANVASMTRRQVTLDGTVDASAIYLHGVQVAGATHDVFFVTTTYGKTIAIDADAGTILWEYTPSSYNQLAGSAQITTATPVADPGRAFIYAASPDGYIQKLAVADGHVAWHTSITKLPTREKIASALNFFNGRVIAVTGGYIGDAPPYQGHVAILDGAAGTLLHVWNTLCSGQTGLLDPASCPESDSAIWGRAGAVVDSTTGNIYIATGNALWDGTTNWGDAVLELNPDATTMLGNFTPANTAQLNADDADLGSTSPVLLGGGLVAQGGKDAIIRVLDWSRMAGTTPHQDNESSQVATPSGDRLFTEPAVFRSGGGTWLIAADNGATTAWTLQGQQLAQQWHVTSGGTSPVVVDGLAFVYNPSGGLNVYEATTGKLVTTLSCGGGHWNSPIVVDGRIALPEGNANSHQTSGVLDIWRVP
ncbi:MAG: PQQ-binding-like beta-propeller repeat protein, partial [Gemmatimonadaceae bacterium]